LSIARPRRRLVVLRAHVEQLLGLQATKPKRAKPKPMLDTEL
jgi:hypothetical protein